MAKLFISDIHFQHEKLVKVFGTRPFKTVQEHDISIFENIMNTIKSYGKEPVTLRIIGDIVVGGDCTEETKVLLKELSQAARVMFIPGNHDTKAKIKVYQECGLILEGAMVEFGHDLVLQHAPIHPCQLADPWTPKEGRFKACIHGHMHNDIVMRHDVQVGDIADPRYVNVACEHVGYKPIDYKDIKARLRENGVI